MGSLKEKVEEVIRIEKEAYDLYRLVGATTTNMGKKEILVRLAEDAIKHLNIIEKKCKKLSPSLCTYFQHFVPEVEFHIDEDDEAALLQALKIALRNKKKLSKLYSNLSATEKDPEWRAMFEELAKAEQEHIKFVEEERRLLSNEPR